MGLGLQAQVTRLSFRPSGASYSLALDRIVMIAGSPNQLHIYDPVAGTDQTVPLSEAPMNLSLSPDGKYAAVAYLDAVAYVDLQAAVVLHTYSGLAVGSTGYVVFGSGYIYVLPGYQGSLISIDTATGQTTSTSDSYVTAGVFDAFDNAIYNTQDGISPDSLERFNATGALAYGQTQFPYFALYSICGPLFLSRTGSVIYTGCGAVFSASSDSSKDMRYLGTLPGLTYLQSLSTSDTLNQIAAVPNTGDYRSPAEPTDAIVELFEASSLNRVGQFATTPFVSNSASYTAHGRWVFYNSSSTNLFIITQADSSAGLQLDFALENVSLGNANSCSATFASSSATAISAGSFESAQVVAGEDCAFTATSNVPWITLSSGYYGSGNTNLTYLVRPNLSASARSGTISLGSQTLTVNQDGAGAAAAQIPLSIKPVAADYDTAMDKIVMVSSYPNELHLYDPVSQADQIVPLSSAPVSVSVRPDGLFAAVGHDGQISIVDLQAASVTQIIRIDMRVGSIIMAGNGYVYAFPTINSYPANVYSVLLSPLTITVSGNSSAINPRLNASGTSIYTSQGKYDITSGPAQALNFEDSISGTNLWLSQDGNRMVTSSGSVYFTSSIRSQDLTPDGTLSGATSVGWAASSQAQHQTAVLVGDPPSYVTATDSQLQIYADNGLQLLSQIPLPTFSNGGTSYISHGRFLFWNAASTKLFAITQADSTSGLVSDYAVYTVSSPESLPACTYELSPTSLNLPSAFSFNWFIQVTSNCSWTPVISNNWLYSQTTATVGNGQLALTGNTNYGAARSATVTVGNQVATISQASSACTYALSPASQSFSQAGGTGTVVLTTTDGCAWSIQSTASWLTVSSSQTGSGSATVQFAVAANTSSAVTSQKAILNIAGIGFAVSQVTVPVSAAMTYVPVTPCRVADTRNPAGQFGGPYISGLSVRTLYVGYSACNIPYNATAYSLNVAVVPHGALGYLTVWPTGEQQPTVATLNSDGRVKSNAAIVNAGTNGAVNFYATNDTDLVVDINGYFVAAATNTGLAFYAVTPCRLSDTRNAAGALGGPALTGGAQRNIPVLQSGCGLPSSAQAYSLNFSAVPHSALGYLTSWPTGQNQPLVATLNAPTGVVTSNAAIVPAGTSGDLSIYATNDADLVIDTAGYFAPPSSGGLNFYSVAPCRILDTRNAGNEQPFVGTLQVIVGGLCNIPSDASAVVLNATVVPASPLGYVTLWPFGSGIPYVATLTANDGAITSNMAIVPMSSGAINAYATNPTHLVVDVSGFFAP